MENKFYTVNDFMKDAATVWSKDDTPQNFKNAICDLIAGKRGSENMDVLLRGYALAVNDKIESLNKCE